MCPHLSASAGDSRPRRASCERASAPQVGGSASRPPSSLAARSLALARGLSPPFSPPSPVTHKRIYPPEPPPQAGSLPIARPGLGGRKGVGCAGRGAARGRVRHRRDTCGGAGRSSAPARVGGRGEWPIQAVVATGLPVSSGGGRDHPPAPVAVLGTLTLPPAIIHTGSTRATPLAQAPLPRPQGSIRPSSSAQGPPTPVTTAARGAYSKQGQGRDRQMRGGGSDDLLQKLSGSAP